MKKIKYILFVFVMLMLNSTVTAQTFPCFIDSYYVYYNENGEIESVTYMYKADEADKADKVEISADFFYSEFKPQHSLDCPLYAIAFYDGVDFHVLKDKDKDKNLNNFRCTIGMYRVEYTKKGNVYALYTLPDFNKLDVEVLSLFLPKNGSECPKDAEVVLQNGKYVIRGIKFDNKDEKIVCNLQGYTMYFDKNGKLVRVFDENNEYVDKTVSSSFSPKSSSECPTDVEISETSNEIRFISNEFSSGDYQNYNPNDIKSCGFGSKKIENIPALIPRTTNIIYTIIQIAVPVVLVLLGSIDLVKGIIAQKEEDIKKGQKTFIKRLIAGAIIFFIFMLIKLFVSLVADNDNDNNTIIDCLECFIENKCD